MKIINLTRPRVRRCLLPAVALALPTLITLLWHSSHAATAGSAVAQLARREHEGGGKGPRLQIGIAVGVSAKPEHVSQSACVRMQ